MIVIDGQQTEISLRDFENLEQVLDEILDRGHVADRVVTDVFVDNEPFTEIYPHQAEDIGTDGIGRLELKSMPVPEMAEQMAAELYKVITLMAKGGREVAELFRQADDAEALETYQDLLDVIRSFLNLVGVLRDTFSVGEQREFLAASQELNELFTEMSEVLTNEDWILLADLLEYEFLPAVENWEKVIGRIEQDIRTVRA